MTDAADPFRLDPDACFTKEEAAHFLNVSPRTLEKWAQEGDGPIHAKKAGRYIRYSRRHLVEWLEVRRVYGSYAHKAAELEQALERLRDEFARYEEP